MPNVMEIVEKWLRENGYQGLKMEDCSCDIDMDGIAPCGSIHENCEACYRVPCTKEKCEYYEYGDDYSCEAGHDPNNKWCMTTEKPLIKMELTRTYYNLTKIDVPAGTIIEIESKPEKDEKMVMGHYWKTKGAQLVKTSRIFFMEDLKEYKTPEEDGK